MLEMAFAASDHAEEEKERKWFKDHSRQDEIAGFDAQEVLFSGKLTIAREQFRQLAAPTLSAGLREAAGTTITDEAVAEAEFGNFAWAKTTIDKNLRGAPKTNVIINAAMVLSMSGDSSRSEALISKLHHNFPKDTLVNAVWIPVAKAEMDIRRGEPTRAIFELEVARPYELGSAAAFLPNYLRGQAYLQKLDGPNALREFETILKHRGVESTSELCVLANLGVARSWRMTGNLENSRSSYRRFLDLWSDADPDIPILLEAKAEYGQISLH